MSAEKSVKVEFEGYVVDLFIAESGNLGMTVEVAPSHEDNHCVDIFVTKDLKVTNI
jgi:hypothetical protein